MKHFVLFFLLACSCPIFGQEKQNFSIYFESDLFAVDANQQQALLQFIQNY